MSDSLSAQEAQIKSDYDFIRQTAVYDPYSISEQDFKAGFTARLELVDYLVEHVKKSKGGNDHLIMIAARGMGKSSLLRRLAIGVKEDIDASKRWIPLLYREEQYNINRIDVFWKNTCDSLAQWCEDAGYQDEANGFDDLVENKDIQGDKLLASIEALCKKTDKQLLLMIDNFDIILNNLKNEDQWQLRKFLSRKNGPLMFAASHQMIEGLSDKNAAFYDYFKSIEIKPLSLEELNAGIKGIARMRGSAGQRVVKHLDENPGRIKVLHTYTAGNPRTLILMYRAIESICLIADTEQDANTKDEAFQSFMPTLHTLVDNATPLYKHITEELPDQPRQIIDAIALGWNPITAKDIAIATGIPPSSISSQLKRLRQEGYIENVSLSANKNGVQIRERFYNIWYLMRHAGRRVKNRLRFLTAAIEDLFDENQKKSIGAYLLQRNDGFSEANLSILRALPAAEQNTFFKAALGKLETSAELRQQWQDVGAKNELFNLALAQLDKLQYQEAARSLSTILEAPDCSETEKILALRFRGFAYVGQAEFENALADYTALIELPGVPTEQMAETLINRGLTWDQQGDIEKALADFTAVIELSGATVEQVSKALFNRGVIYGQQGDVEKELTDYTAVKELPGAPAEQASKALFNRGFTYEQQGDVENATTDYTAVIELSGATVEQVSKALFNRGITYFQQGDIEKAISDYTTMTEIPSLPIEQVAEALFNRGLIYRQQGDVENALADYTAVIELPGAPVELLSKALVNRGFTYGQQVDVENALADYTAVIELSGAPVEQVSMALVNRSDTYGQQGEFEKTLKDLDAIIGLKNLPSIRYISAFYRKANFFFDFYGDLSEARLIYEQALALDSDSLITNANLAWLALFETDSDLLTTAKTKIDSAEFGKTGLQLLEAAELVTQANFGHAFDLLDQVLIRNDDDLNTIFEDDLLRLIRLFKIHNFGERLLDRLLENNWELKRQPLYYGAYAYIHGADKLRDINPELRSVAQPIFEWLNRWEANSNE